MLLFFQGLVIWYITKQNVEKEKCSPRVQCSELVLPPGCSQDPKLHNLMVNAVKTTFEFRFHTCPYLVSMQSSIAPHWLLCQGINAFQEAPGLLVPCCAVPPIDIGKIEVPHKEQSL